MIAFGVLALLLASVGVYAMFASMAAAREREFGVRVALGSSRGAIAAPGAASGRGVDAVGLVAGAVGTVFVSRSIGELSVPGAPVRSDRVRFRGRDVCACAPQWRSWFRCAARRGPTHRGFAIQVCSSPHAGMSCPPIDKTAAARHPSGDSRCIATRLRLTDGSRVPPARSSAARCCRLQSSWRTRPGLRSDGRLAVSIDGDLYVQAPNAGAWTRLTSGPAWDREPAWSRDGTSIVFSSDRAGGFDLWRVAVPASGTPSAQPASRSDSRPRPSPMGSPRSGTMAASFSSEAAVTMARLWSRARDGTEQRLTRGQVAERSPAVSPDGARVAYVAVTETGRRLRVRALAGDSARAADSVVIADRDVERPAWSPRRRPSRVHDRRRAPASSSRHGRSLRESREHAPCRAGLGTEWAYARRSRSSEPIPRVQRRPRARRRSRRGRKSCGRRTPVDRRRT